MVLMVNTNSDHGFVKLRPSAIVYGLNSILHPDEVDIEAGKFKSACLRRALSYLPTLVVGSCSINLMGKVPLFGESRDSGVMGVLSRVFSCLPIIGADRIGVLDLVRGRTSDSEDGESGYENVTLETRVPLILRDGETLPRCKVELRAAEGDYGLEREDYIGHKRGWERADISHLLPEGVFTGDKIARRAAG